MHSPRTPPHRDPVKGLLLACVCFSCLALPSQGNVTSGLWSKSEIPEGWVVYESKNYQIQSQAGREKAVRLGDHMEVMLRVYRSMFRPDKDGSKRQPIKLFKDEAAFHAYNPEVPGAAAYYSPGKHEMVCYDTGKWSDRPEVEGPTTGKETARDRLARRMKRFEDMMNMDILGCAAHEGWHQYFHWYVGSLVELPSWINEGMGDYFYTAAPKNVKGKKMPATLGGMNSTRLPVLKAAERQNLVVPLPQFLRMMQQQYYSNPAVCYSQGWGLCQFLLHSGNPKYEKIIPTYIRLVRDDTNMETVTERAFKGLDLAVMEAEFKKWIGGLKLDIAEDPAEVEENVPTPPAGVGESPVPPAEQPPVPATGGTPPGGTPPAPAPGTGGGTPPGGTPPAPAPTPGGTGGSTPPGGTPPAPTPTPGGGGTPPGGNGG